MCSDAHQCELSQLTLSKNGASPGRSNCTSRNELPPPVNWPFGALLSEFGVHGFSGYDLGLHSAIENHGATDRSNQ